MPWGTVLLDNEFYFGWERLFSEPELAGEVLWVFVLCVLTVHVFPTYQVKSDHKTTSLMSSPDVLLCFFVFFLFFFCSSFYVHNSVESH